MPFRPCDTQSAIGRSVLDDALDDDPDVLVLAPLFLVALGDHSVDVLDDCLVVERNPNLRQPLDSSLKDDGNRLELGPVAVYGLTVNLVGRIVGVVFAEADSNSSTL